MTENEEIRKLKANCSLLEDQIKTLVKTEFKLRRTQADLIQSQKIINEYNLSLKQQVEERTKDLEQANREIRTLNDQLKEENLRMSAELNVVHRLQEMILPSADEFSSITGLDIDGYMKAANEVGGDYYDVLINGNSIDSDDVLHIGIGDVTGHGLESGVLMLMTQASIRTLIEHGVTDLTAILQTLNRLIYKNARRMKTSKMLTFMLLEYRKNYGVTFSGLHEQLLVVRKDGTVEPVDTDELGIFIGLEPDIGKWVAQKHIPLNPGDGVVMYTDGITEARNHKKIFYGLDRLCGIISKNWIGASAEQVRCAIINDVMSYMDKQNDDIALVVMKV